MKVAKAICYVVLLLGIVDGVGKITSGNTNGGIMEIIICGVIAVLGLTFFNFVHGLLGDDKSQN
jgi:hypothetical protein